MKKLPLISALLLLFLTALPPFAAAQTSEYRSQEVSETDGIPVLVKHLPDWETVRDQTKLTNSVAELKSVLGERAVLEVVDLAGGAEAVIATYPAGKLLLIEFPTPQASAGADAAIQAKLAETPGAVYRRIGNYNAIVFDAEPSAANALLDKIRYQKQVQWLGEDPYLIGRIERYLVGTSADVLISTALFIVFSLGGAVVAGVVGGYIFFRIRDEKRSHRTAFSDAGGLTRLNLDELSE